MDTMTMDPITILVNSARLTTQQLAIMQRALKLAYLRGMVLGLGVDKIPGRSAKNETYNTPCL